MFVPNLDHNALRSYTSGLFQKTTPQAVPSQTGQGCWYTVTSYHGAKGRSIFLSNFPFFSPYFPRRSPSSAQNLLLFSPNLL